jgi:tRNA nucleotidyltransferase (CCA-adding enzyme)
MARTDLTDSFIASLGVEAYRVGGSVRDELLGRPVKDTDYMVRGVPMRDLGELLKANSPKKVTPLILRDGRQAGWRAGNIEIVLPRTDRPRPARPGESVHRAFDIVVDPSLSLAEDAVRRDFTFNALYLGVGDGNVQDPTERGLHDLQHKLVNTTHPDSFRDDPLRTLRALRFVSVLGYDLSSLALAQMFDHAAAVTGLSANGYASGTVLSELSKILMGADAVKALRLARDTGVLNAILPELSPMVGFDQASRYHDLTTDEHTFKALETAVHVDAPVRVRWSLLFHDSGKPEACWVGKDGRQHYYASKVDIMLPFFDEETGEKRHKLESILTEDHEVVGERIWRKAAARLSMPRDLREDVSTLIRNHMVPTNAKNLNVRARRMRVKFGDEMFRDLLLHRMCDTTGKGKGVSGTALQNLAQMESARKTAAAAGVPTKTSQLAITGHDCIEIGLTGRDIGRAMADILDEVVCDPTEKKMSREWQLRRLGYPPEDGGSE